MRKWIYVLFILSLFSFAKAEEDFQVDRDYVIPGMAASWNQGYAPEIQNEAFHIYLPVRSSTETGRIKAELICDASGPNPFSGASLSASFYKGNDGVYRIVLKPAVHRLRVNGDYAVTIRLTGENTESNIPLTLKIRNARMPDEEIRPYLSGIDSELQIGNDGEISFTLENRSAYACLTTLTVTLSDPSGSILPAHSSVYELTDMLPMTAKNISLPVTVTADASVSTKTVHLRFSFTALNQKGTWEETLSLPVSQTIRMEAGEIEYAPVITAGEIASVSVPVMNLGRADLLNTFVKLTLNGITEGRTVLVGNIESGRTQTAKITFSPPKDFQGDAEGSILITSEDPWGNTESITRRISLTVNPAPVYSDHTPTQQNTREASFPIVVCMLGALSLLLLIILLLQGAILKRRIRKLEEDRL